MKRIFFKALTILGILTAMLFFAETNRAQPRLARGRVYTKAQVGEVVRRVEENVDRFVKQYNRSLDRSRLNGTKREDFLNKRARDLESATDELRREFDRRDTWSENKDEVRRCVDVATDINQNMKNRRYGAAAETNWRRVVRELNTLANLYNVPRVGSGLY